MADHLLPRSLKILYSLSADGSTNHVSRFTFHAPESDLDIFVEVEAITPELRRKISEVAWEVGLEMDRVITTLVATREQLERGPMGANPLVHQVMQEGIRI